MIINVINQLKSLTDMLIKLSKLHASLPCRFLCQNYFRNTLGTTSEAY